MMMMGRRRIDASLKVNVWEVLMGGERLMFKGHCELDE